MVQLSTSYMKSFEIDNLPNREKTDMKGENLSFPIVIFFNFFYRLLKELYWVWYHHDDRPHTSYLTARIC